MGVAHTVAEAWAIESKERGVTRSTPYFDSAENLFYAGAAAMFAMVTAHPDRHDLYNFLQTTKAELLEYLELNPDA